MTPFSLAEGGLCARLAACERISEPVALVVAHPDDETVGLGSRLHLFDRLTLIHVTGGAPADMADARRAGFDTSEAYAAARVAELAAALEVLGARPVRALRYGLMDQAVVDHLPELVRRLTADCAGQAAVVTHAYEGGHPDHDACALAVARARAVLGASAPAACEFAGYYGVDGTLHANRFHADPDRPETAWKLTPAERDRKARAFAAHASQRRILDNFPPGRERLRTAPAYDFTRPPPSGEPHYDRYGWALTGDVWRARVGGVVIKDAEGDPGPRTARAS